MHTRTTANVLGMTSGRVGVFVVAVLLLTVCALILGGALSAHGIAGAAGEPAASAGQAGLMAALREAAALLF